MKILLIITATLLISYLLLSVRVWNYYGKAAANGGSPFKISTFEKIQIMRGKLYGLKDIKHINV